MKRPLFPNLFVVGAMKAGTSSFHEYLHQHPEIFMSRFKEPQYFAPHRTREGFLWGQGNPHPEPGIDWYLRLFQNAGDVKYAGESSVSYTSAPWMTGCEKRIYEFNPHARIIYLMRDPVERAISHYWHFVAAGREDRNILAAMQKNPQYAYSSDYAMQIRPYLEQFGHDQVCAVTLEELGAAPETTLRRLFTWLGVDADIAIDTHARHNVGSGQVRQTRRGLVFFSTFFRTWRGKKLLASGPPILRNAITQIISRPIVRRTVENDAAIEFLRSALRERTVELSELLNRDFVEWKTLSMHDEPVSVIAS